MWMGLSRPLGSPGSDKRRSVQAYGRNNKRRDPNLPRNPWDLPPEPMVRSLKGLKGNDKGIRNAKGRERFVPDPYKDPIHPLPRSEAPLHQLPPKKGLWGKTARRTYLRKKQESEPGPMEHTLPRWLFFVRYHGEKGMFVMASELMGWDMEFLLRVPKIQSADSAETVSNNLAAMLEQYQPLTREPRLLRKTVACIDRIIQVHPLVAHTLRANGKFRKHYKRLIAVWLSREFGEHLRDDEHTHRVAVAAGAQAFYRVYSPAFWGQVQRNIQGWYSLNSHQVRELLIAAAKLKQRTAWDVPESLVSSLAGQVHLTTGGHSHSHWSNGVITDTLWALAKLGVTADRVSWRLPKAAAKGAATMRTPEVAKAMWAIGKLGYRANQVPADIQEAVERHAGKMTAQEVANCLRACVETGLAVESGVAVALLGEIRDVVKDMNAQEVANTLRACAALGVPKARVPEGLLQAVPKHSKKFYSKMAADALWGMAKLGMAAEEVPEELLAALQRVAKGRRPQDVGDTLWALATLGVERGRFPEDLLGAVELVGGEMDVRAAAKTAWAWQRLGLEAEGLPKAVREAVARQSAKPVPKRKEGGGRKKVGARSTR